MISEPLETNILQDIEAGMIPAPTAHSSKEISSFFASTAQKYGWDLLAARSLWAFGPSEERGPNVFLNEYLPSQGCFTRCAKHAFKFQHQRSHSPGISLGLS